MRISLFFGLVLAAMLVACSGSAPEPSPTAAPPPPSPRPLATPTAAPSPSPTAYGVLIRPTTGPTPPSLAGRLVFVRDGDLWFHDGGTGEATAWLQTPEDESWPAWSPDGQQIAFVRAGGAGTADIWVSPIRGQARRLAAVGGVARHSVWSADGKAVLFAVDRETTSDLWQAEVAGGEPQRLQLGLPAVVGPLASLGGGLVLVARAGEGGPWALYRWRPGTEPERLVELAGPAAGLAVAAGGQVAVSSPGERGVYDLWLFDPGERRLRRLTEFSRTLGRAVGSGAVGALEPSWSPDGSRLAFRLSAPTERGPAWQDRLMLVSPSGGEPVLLTTGPRDAMPAWGR